MAPTWFRRSARDGLVRGLPLIQRGDLRWFRFPEPDKRRPVLVVGRSELLSSLGQIPVIPLSSQIRGLRWEVRLGSADGLPTECVLKPEWLRSIERAQLGPLSAQLPEGKWNDVRISVMEFLGFAGE